MKLKVFWPGLILLLTSCTSPKIVDRKLQDPLVEIATWHWSGEGRAKVIQGKDSYNMAFEGLLGNRRWAFTLTHPLKGEYFYSFDWESGQVVLNGTFPTQWDERQLREMGLKDSKELYQLFHQWGRILAFIQSKNWDQCSANGDVYICPDQVKIFNDQQLTHVRFEDEKWMVEVSGSPELRYFVLESKVAKTGIIKLQFQFSGY